MISIVIPIQKNNEIRDRNLRCCLESIIKQTYQNNEIIIVEQWDKEYYYSWMGEKYIKIKDPKNRGYNLAWGRNCGAKVAEGDIILLMDADLIIPKDYLEKVSQMKSLFASGSNEYVMTDKESTKLYYKRKDLNVFNLNTQRACGYNKRKHMYYGLILIFKKEFWEKFGGFCESFFRYGREDNEAAYRIMQLLGKDEDEIERIDSPVYHLFHQGRDLSNISINKRIQEKLQLQDVNTLCELFKSGGNPKEPMEIDID